jgi:hypothetical protein
MKTKLWSVYHSLIIIMLCSAVRVEFKVTYFQLRALNNFFTVFLSSIFYLLPSLFSPRLPPACPKPHQTHFFSFLPSPSSHLQPIKVNSNFLGNHFFALTEVRELWTSR